MAKEKICACYMICMLLENRTFHPVLYFRKQPKSGVFKPLMHDVQNGETHFKNLAAFATKFLKCV